MTIAEQMRYDGLKALLDVNGIAVTSSTGEMFVVIVESVAAIDNPFEIQKQKLPVFCLVKTLSENVSSPRAITSFTDENNRVFRVLNFNDGTDSIQLEWLCDADMTA